MIDVILFMNMFEIFYNKLETEEDGLGNSEKHISEVTSELTTRPFYLPTEKPLVPIANAISLEYEEGGT